MTTALTVKAPWTEEHVRSLNGYQQSGSFHPFTCGACRDRMGIRKPCPAPTTDGVCTLCGGHGVVFDDHLLEATQAGWVCPTCSYTQDWAWEWMLNGAWEDFRLPTRKA